MLKGNDLSQPWLSRLCTIILHLLYLEPDIALLQEVQIRNFNNFSETSQENHAQQLLHAMREFGYDGCYAQNVRVAVFIRLYIDGTEWDRKLCC